MSEDVQLEGRSIVVRTPGAGFHAFGIPKGFLPDAWHSVVAAIMALYLEHGMFPVLADVQKRSGVRANTIARMLDTDEMLDLLEYRGIAFDAEQELSYEQNTVLTLLADPSAGTLPSVLKRAGVPRPRFEAWMRQPAFARARKEIAEKALANSQAMLVEGVVRKAEVGDLNAIKLGLAMTGRYDPDTKKVQDARQVVLVIVESVIRHVADPDVRAAILADVQASAVGFSTIHPELEV